MRPIVPAIGAATVALTSEAAGTALGLPDPLALVVGVAGMSAGVGAFVAAHASAVAARRERAERHRRLRRAAHDALRLRRLLDLCTDEELARLRELRRQVRQGERSEF